MPDDSAPDYDLAAALPLTDPGQYRALFEPTRTQLVSLLLDRAATTSELAQILGKPKGTIGFHLKTLEAAGLVRVVRTRRVRALEAKYYGRTARVFLFEQVGAGSGAVVRQLRQAADEAGAVPAGSDLAVNGGVRYARIPPHRAQTWSDRVHALLDEFDREPRVGEQVYGLVVGLYPTDRPRLSAPDDGPDDDPADGPDDDPADDPADSPDDGPDDESDAPDNEGDKPDDGALTRGPAMTADMP